MRRRAGSAGAASSAAGRRYDESRAASRKSRISTRPVREPGESAEAEPDRRQEHVEDDYGETEGPEPNSPPPGGHPRLRRGHGFQYPVRGTANV
jgi:hypothetical protein